MDELNGTLVEKKENLHLGWPCRDPDMFTFIEKKLERRREAGRDWEPGR